MSEVEAKKAKRALRSQCQKFGDHACTREETQKGIEGFIVDFETTGNCRYGDSYDSIDHIIRIVAMHVVIPADQTKPLQAKEMFSAMVKPNHAMVPFVHSYNTLEKDGAPFPTVWKSFVSFVATYPAGSCLIGHNVHLFHMPFLFAHLQHLNLPFPDQLSSCLDTLSLVRYLKKQSVDFPDAGSGKNSIGDIYHAVKGEYLKGARDPNVNCVAVATILSTIAVRSHLFGNLQHAMKLVTTIKQGYGLRWERMRMNTALAMKHPVMKSHDGISLEHRNFEDVEEEASDVEGEMDVVESDGDDEGSNWFEEGGELAAGVDMITAGTRHHKQDHTLLPPACEKTQSRFSTSLQEGILPSFSPASVASSSGRGAAPETVSEAFGEFFDHSVKELVVAETNKYHSMRTGDANDLMDENDFQKLIGALIIAGLNGRKERVSDWFDSDERIAIPYLSRFYNISQFNAILRHLHFTDIEDRGDDAAYKIRPLLTLLRVRFEKAFNCKMNVTVEEAIVPLRSGAGVEQFGKRKTSECGIKVWVLADVATGYVKTFDVCTGQKEYTDIEVEGIPDNLPKRCRAACRLANTAGILGQGHIIFANSLFSSVELARYLLKRDTHYVGIIHRHHRGFPYNLIKQDSKVDMGSVKQVQDQEGILATSFMDYHEVLFLSTFLPPPGLFFTKRLIRGKRVVEIPSPPIREMHTNCENVVERVNRERSAYKIGIKELKRWYLHLFFYLLDASIANARIVYNETIPKDCGRQGLSNKDFRLQLATELLEGVKPKQSHDVFVGPSFEEEKQSFDVVNWGQSPKQSKGMKKKKKQFQGKNNTHEVCKLVLLFPEAAAKWKSKMPYKRTCVVCHKHNSKVTTGCNRCGVPLHTTFRTNCWEKYHLDHDQ
eukprot:m.106475 g.106475  ORF g.106475 m.106475 type:complete len:887 (+) comp9153_c0_seq1:166-2826(+)